MSAETSGIFRVCPNCSKRFSVCQKCWRGHWYCSQGCSAEARRKSRSRANRRYRKSDAGRQCQRMAQNRYRQRKVRDHSSTKSDTSLGIPPLTQFNREVASVEDSNRCYFCGGKIHSFIDGRRFSRKQVRRRRGGG